MAFTQQAPIGTPDFNLITKTLAGLQPDSRLQEYAMLHKNNPYIVSLAKSESDRRKALRAAAQGQNAGQMPTVVDQDIAGMAPPRMVAQLPENQGIAQLPTPNVQNMADGGIAGYDDDEGMAQGGMFEFAQHSEPVLRMAGGGHIPRYQGNTVDGSVVRSNPMFNIPGFQAVQPRAQFTQAGAPENQTLWEQMSSSLQSEGLQRKIQIIEDRIARGIAGPEEKAYYAQLKAQASGQPVLAAPKDVVNPDEVLMAADKAKKAPAATKGTTDKPDTGAPSLKNTSTPMNTGLGNLNTMVGDARNRFLRNANATVEDVPEIEDMLARRKAMMPQGKAMESYEASLKKEEEGEPLEKEKAGLMALTQGFLAVAAGESPNALTNIAKGLGVGLKDYGDALKEFKKAGKERQKQLADIENARRAEDRGDVEAVYKYQESIKDREQRRRSSIDQGLASLEAHGISGAYSLAGANVHAGATLGAANIHAAAQKDYLKEIRGGQLVENAIKDLRAQIAKSNKYGTPEEHEAEFQKRWPEVLQMNPGLAKYAGSVGGGTAVDTTGFRVLR